ncbi:hypothetical protein T09_12109 [Trichinella sp. T9]|nr:hypothetical protein T09_12109 [Trichinella sp. T9]
MCKLWTLQHFTRMNFESGKHSPTQLLSGFKLVANRDYGSPFEIIEKENSLSAWRAIFTHQLPIVGSLGVVTNLLLIHPSFPTAAAILHLYYCFSCNERERVREFKNCLADNKRNVYMMLWNNEC